jgi:hypothetical protein
MRLFVLTVAAFAALGQSAATETFKGVITDSHCSDGYHGRMRMGDTDSECAKACIESHGGTFLLYDGLTAYELSDQKTPGAFAGQKVTVTGTLDVKTNTIEVRSIVAS